MEGHEEEEIAHGGQASTIKAGVSARASITTAMTSNFKQNGDKFEGKLSDTLYDTMAAYLEISDDLELNHDQNRDYLHHLFSGEAKKFYRARVEENQGTFAEACAAMVSEFDSLTRERTDAVVC